MRRTVCAVAVLVGLFLAAPLFAQGVTINPTTVCFTPSADHSATLFDTTAPVVTRYDMRVYVSTDLNTLVTSLDLGKPSPGTDGKICVTNAIWFAALTPRTKFVGKVAAVGPTGEGVSIPSDPFGMQGPPGAGGKPEYVKK